MTMISDPLVPELEEYLALVEHPEPEYPVCEEQVALAALVRRSFAEEDIYVDTELLAKYMKLQKYFPFKLLPWEKFLFTLHYCTFRRADGMPRWDTLFSLIARGAGKDGMISFNAFCMVSPYNPAKDYDVDICANNETQGMRPLKDVNRVLENPKYADKLAKHFYHTQEMARGKKNGGCIVGHTNNPKGADGLRSGEIVLNEVHAYPNMDNIKVFTTGLGKKDHPRTSIWTSNGEVSDGPLDEYIAQGLRILFDGEHDHGVLPFICRLPDKDHVHDKRSWHMANPSLRYRPTLMHETEKEYYDWLEHPERNGDFLTKRMNLRALVKDIVVTSYDNIKATKQPLPEIPKGTACVIGVDYAEISDWASCNVHFRVGDTRVDLNHSWICRDSKTLHRVRAPWRDWVEKGDCTFVEDVTINPDLITEWIRGIMLRYTIKKLAMDHHRWTLVSESFKKIGFDANDKSKVKLVRPSDIMRVEPLIQTCFDRHLYAWGDQPALRWAVNNTKRVRSSRSIGTDTGNFIYAKIEAKSRKTDPFMALVASMTVEDVLGSGKPVTLPKIGAVKL